MTLILTHPDCLRHDPGPGHPENPQRLATVIAALESALPELELIDAPLATPEQLARVHDPDYIERLFAQAPTDGHLMLDPDTVMNSASLNATLAASGAMVAAIDAVIDGSQRRAFCAVRPPGHHAERDRAMGFCLFNAVAVGAAHALERHRLERVAIVDFDVHHGNGTQHMFETEPRVLYVSSHQLPLYPGTGQPSEVGLGNILNIGLAPSAGSKQLRRAYRDQVVPAVAEFDPQLLLVSAGFDAHRLDPLANLELVTADYQWLGELLSQLAEQHCDGRLVATLEGGYSLTALADSVPAFVAALS